MNKLIISTTDLARAAKRCALVAQSNSVIPVLESALINVHTDHVWFMATNLETTINTRMPCEGSGDFSFSFNVKDILDLCDKLPEQPISIIFDEKTKAIYVTADFNEVSYGSDDIKDFPKLPEDVNAIEFKVAADLVDKMSIAAKFVSKDTLRPAMTGVLFELDKEELTLVATDAHCLYRAEPYALPGITESNAFVVPPKTIASLVNIGYRGEIEISYNTSHIRFKTPDTELYARLIDARFPDYRSVVPRDNSQKLVYDLKTLKQAASLASIAANKTTNQLNFVQKDGKTSVQAQDIDFSKSAKAKPIDPIECACKDMTFAFNAGLLMRILNGLTEKAVVMGETPTRAFIFSDDTCKDIFLLMPLMSGV